MSFRVAAAGAACVAPACAATASNLSFGSSVIAIVSVTDSPAGGGVKRGTLAAILWQAGLTPDGFLKLLD